MLHWKKLTNPNYLGSYAFEPGEEKPLTIREICTEEVTNPSDPDHLKEICVVAYFTQNEKPLILNKTNLKAIERLAGTPDVEKWPGTGIILCVQKVRAFGELVDAVRIRPVKPFVCADCGGIITGFGGKSHAEIREHTQKTYKRPLCAACATKAAAALKSAGPVPPAEIPPEAEAGPDQAEDQTPRRRRRAAG